ncbi:MAG: DNA translocase FtsK [Eubacteriales bacterium]|nr:DNA translocase FtsK [Eubacteriales bacterium]
MPTQKKKTGRPAGSKNKSSKEKMEQDLLAKQAKSRIKDEIWAIILMALGAFFVIGLQTQAAGEFGRIISDLLKGLFAEVAYALPYYLILYGMLLFLKRAAHITGRSVFFLVLIFLSTTMINSARFLKGEAISWTFDFLKNSFDQGVLLEGGGAFGMNLGFLLVKAIGLWGLYLFSAVIILVSLLLVVNSPVSQFFDNWKLRRSVARENKQNREMLGSEMPEELAKEEKPTPAKPAPFVPAEVVKPQTVTTPIEPLRPEGMITAGQMKIIDYMKDEELFEGAILDSDGFGLEDRLPIESGKGLAEEAEVLTAQEASRKKKKAAVDLPDLTEEMAAGIAGEKPEYAVPPIDLLSKTPIENKAGESTDLKAKGMKLEATLKNFGVNAKVLQVTKGPAVTRYEIQPDVGVKVSSIVRLADDIALNLEAKSIRIEAPIPGKAAVGIEVENERINLVAVRDIIESKEFKEAKSKITFAVGKDISGNSIVANLKEMPHLLIAGSTGSGKSVCLNSLIISILYRARPEEVKFVLIDPKVVELGNYNGIPHLLIPVVTEPTKAAAALNWAVAEMTSRYKKFAERGVRDLESYNKSLAEKENESEEKPLPQIVIIIDELADLMMAAPSQVEESICRLAQMARAAGMHLIVATQRPSVDVITGVIKANIPSRISFAVSSQFDSRTILDMAGAEKLVGKGDMLFNPLGMAKPTRVQGAFISDSEVHRVIDFLKNQGESPEYATDVINSIEKTYESAGEEDVDELLQEAIETVVRAEQASVSMLQRRFRIGYNRAARLVDMMEARGIIGPSDGSRPRKVLLSEEELLNLEKQSGEV